MTDAAIATERDRYLELRADWLKLRGCLVDPITSLPALPAVLEDVRRRTENGEVVGLIYLDLSTEAVIESIYGWEAYDSLLRQAAQKLTELCRIGLQEPLLSLFGVRGDEFLIFATIGGARPTVLLEELRRGIIDQLGNELQVQTDNELPRAVSIQSGCALVPVDPMVRIERSIYRAIDNLRTVCRRQREARHTERIEELRRIVFSNDIQVRYQPIVSLVDGSVHGFEALSCGPAGSVFESPEVLFSFAEETDHIIDLERICRLESIRGARALRLHRKLFINTSARGFVDPELFCRTLVDQAERSGLKPEDIVIEITERVAITAWQDFRRSVAALRLIGFSIAIDDMGAGYSSLKSVAEVQPEYLKVDMSLIRDIHTSPIKQSLLESLVTMARKLGSRVVAEGVESADELKALRMMQVGFAQGYYFARPAADFTEPEVVLP